MFLYRGIKNHYKIFIHIIRILSLKKKYSQDIIILHFNNKKPWYTNNNRNNPNGKDYESALAFLDRLDEWKNNENESFDRGGHHAERVDVDGDRAEERQQSARGIVAESQFVVVYVNEELDGRAHGVD